MRLRTLGTTLLVALVLAVGVDYVSFAANGSSLLLGKSNYASSATSITRTGAGAALVVNSRPGRPPLKVNRTVKNPNFNADLLDGKNASAFAPAALSPQVATVQGEVASLQPQVSNLQSQVSTLQGQVADLRKYGPLASAAVGYAGAILSSGAQERNVSSVTWNATEGRYEIAFDTLDYSTYSHTAATNVWGSGVACTQAQPRVYYNTEGELHLKFLNAGTGSAMQCNFSFVVFDHA